MPRWCSPTGGVTNRRLFREAAHGRMAALACWVAAALAAGAQSAQTGAGGYVGATACGGCHPAQLAAWQGSDHFQSMRGADQGTVLGDFSDAIVTFNGTDTRFLRRGDAHFVETAGEDGKRGVYRVRYAFGWRPLQQYLVDAGAGRLQAFDIAWDTRSVDAGGQRWFHLQPEETLTPGHPFFWTGHAMNWASHCADCHSTNVVKTPDPKAGGFGIAYAEANVACEACHGPAKEHVRLARSGSLAGVRYAGFGRGPAQRIAWRLLADDRIATPRGAGDAREIDMCGGCHALRTPLFADTAGKPFHEAYRIQLVDEAHYFADGQIREESFVLGSFLQSRMHGRGVTCGDCHDPHSGGLVAEGDGVCAQCHRAGVFDTRAHHGHAPGGPGGACVDCHMPARTYMGVDDRRDHSFPIPRPALSAELGVPNGCTGCHEGRTAAWASAMLRDWGVAERDHWARLLRRLRQGDPHAAPALETLVSDPVPPALVKASLLAAAANLPPARALAPLSRGLADSDALVRRGAAAGARGLSPLLQWQLLRERVADRSAAVRFEVATALSDVLPGLPRGARDAMRELFLEHRLAMEASGDLSASQRALARLDQALGRPAAAREAFERALAIDPANVPTLVDYADFVRQSGEDEAKVGALLRRASAAAPANPVVNAALGLHLVRRGRRGEGLAVLAKAGTAADAPPRFVYLHAVGLDSSDDRAAAIATLRRGIERWPWDAELLATLVIYLDDADSNELQGYLATLVEVAPNAPRVRALVGKYGRTRGGR